MMIHGKSQCRMPKTKLSTDLFTVIVEHKNDQFPFYFCPFGCDTIFRFSHLSANDIYNHNHNECVCMASAIGETKPGSCRTNGCSLFLFSYQCRIFSLLCIHIEQGRIQIASALSIFFLMSSIFAPSFLRVSFDISDENLYLNLE